MRWNRSRSPFVVLALFAAVFVLIALTNRGPRPAEAAAPKPAGKPASSSDDSAVRKATADYVAALNKGNLDEIMAFWAPDAEYCTEEGRATHGRQGITDLFKEVLPQIKGQKVTAQVTSVRTLHPNVAQEDGSLQFENPDGSRDEDRFTAVWVKTDGKWVITSACDLPSNAPDSPSLAYPHLRPLEWLVGEWVDDSPKADVRLTCKWGPNKAFLIVNYEVRHEGQEPLAVTQRIGWDPHNGLVRSWVFDSQGGFGEGNWQRDGNRWVVESSGVLPDGGTGGSTNTWEYADGKTFVWRATDRQVDEQPVADVEVKFVRKPQK
jgi:uncharacterized protein (TIGR02246 family)